MKNRRVAGRNILLLIWMFSGINQLSAQDLVSQAWLHHSIDSMLPGTSYGTSAFTLDDFDRDGDLDITISRREIAGGQVYWYENRSGPWIRHDLGIADERQLGAATTDINSDGYPDLVMGRYWFENPRVLSRSPDSTWTRWAYAGSLSYENHDLVADDFNNDGRDEILGYSQDAGDGTLRLYSTIFHHNWSYTDISDTINATAGKIEGSNGIHGGFAPHGIGDLDGDRFADIVMPLGWYRNPGRNNGGTWKYNPWPFQTGIVPNPYGISMRSWVADMDSDGDNDIVYTDCDVKDSQGYWIQNKHKGKSFVRIPLPSPEKPTGSFHSLAVADFDNDGDLDIFSGEQEDPDRGMKPDSMKERGFIWENTGTKRKPKFELRIIQVDNPGWHDIQVGDVDGDGDLDVVSKVWNKDGRFYHADYWENRTIVK